ncbi:hypothetical protein BU24DRAFT_396414 [Aaosphaeria arxii CBS 175.79]|uniref:Zn(2)-C6 fungal-type domain-containing protein n=1 Tax=Aaosphaeria arxii CBS 175.79 TaxID=1450172 RepID=A0A6A5XFG4_9PLEO|nr:uncharacterized protein BU24DRAFT_396414 [Aaosphaeria arxii CBS 175.79]KAF2011822.1 hypothetical protein BU24DRAFT_396414 [Aaosphaeria arxii CBS 175.79]
MPRSVGAGTTRSRGGCLRCKSRHIKCDEAKPECQVCTSNTIKCPGYEKKFKWSNKHERLHSLSANRGAAEAPQDQPIQTVAPPSSNDEDPAVSAIQTTEPCQIPLESEISGADDSNFTTLMANVPDVWPDFPVFSYEDIMEFTSTMSAFQGQISSHHQNRADVRSNELIVHQLNGSDFSTAQQAPFVLPDLSPGYTDQDLVQHYFRHVCSLFSCFDSSINPFRNLVSAYWGSSETMNLSIQSMSAAHLANHYPSLAQIGLRKRSQAWMSLQKDLHQRKPRKVPADVISLNLMLLGLSSSWHRTSRIGAQYIYIARNLLRQQIDEADEGNTVEFFQNGLLYWEMLLSFIDPVPIAALPGRVTIEPPEDPTSLPVPIVPHPWTGVVTEVNFAFAEIGRILRRQRIHKGLSATGVSLFSDYEVSVSFDVDFATELEKFLLSIKMPPLEKIADLHDRRTSKEDVVRVSMAYRLAGLLEIYAVFPDLLQQRVEHATTTDGFTFGCQIPGSSICDTRAKCLSDLANYILYQIVEPISIRSGSSRMLSLLYVILSSHLQPTKTQEMGDFESGHEEEHEVQPRTLIEERMLALSRKYPQRPQLQMLDIIKEVWHRQDKGDMNVHWLNVLQDKSMQTMMG